MAASGVAIVREVPDSFIRAVTSQQLAESLDPARARRQHQEYRRMLALGGFSVSVVPADESHPDCPFVEDTAVVVAGAALATRPGHPARRGEVEAVVAALAGWVRVERMEDPATLDGGDVLQVGRTVFVGRSERTNGAGVAALARFGAGLGRRVIPVRVTEVLHLKSAVSALDEHTVLVWPEGVEMGAFDGLRVIPISGGVGEAANVVRLPDGRILVAESHPETAETVMRNGFDVVTCDVSEFARADGGLSCLSIRIRG